MRQNISSKKLYVNIPPATCRITTDNGVRLCKNMEIFPDIKRILYFCMFHACTPGLRMVFKFRLIYEC